ncbi:MAG: 30S ribosome-binding factor RbfA [Gammaproteobacteria bacterium AqS3]|nr:30S ribosome-binding factor RbfA [Gammaproteobacteria bacterium AqS3]
MAGSGVREHRAAENILRSLAQILRSRVRDPRLRGITLTSARISTDLYWVDIHFAADPGGVAPAEALRSLERSRGFLRSELAKTWGGMRVPDLRFHLDESWDEARRIDELLRQGGGSDSSDADAGRSE